MKIILYEEGWGGRVEGGYGEGEEDMGKGRGRGSLGGVVWLVIGGGWRAILVASVLISSTLELT